jgi:hypothetical protein
VKLNFNIAILLLLFGVKSIGQNLYKNLLNEAVKPPVYFIYKEPVKQFVEIDRDEIISDYYDAIRQNKKTVDTSILFEIIKNLKSIDTSSWKDSEIEKYYLVDKYPINMDKVFLKLKPTNTVSSEIIVKQIEEINKINDCEKRIYKISRPLFFRSRKYAIIQFQNTICSDERIIEIKLYKKIKHKWKEIQTIFKSYTIMTHDLINTN